MPPAWPVEVVLGARHYIAGVSLSATEHVRRQAAGIGAITSYGAAFALWELPTGGTVPADHVPAVHRRELRRLSDANVIETIGGFERIATRPLDVVYLVAARSSCSRGLEAFGDRWWAPTRAVVTTNATPLDLRRARRYKVGVYTDEGWVAPPIISRQARLSPLSWWQAELVYDQMLSGGPIGEAARTA